MAVPDFQQITLPLLKLSSDGEQHALREAVDRLADQFSLSPADRAELLPSGKQARFANRVGWATTYLKKAGLLRSVGPGRFQITDQGTALLADPPGAIDSEFLRARYPEEMHAFATGRPGRSLDGDEAGATFDETRRTWKLRPEVEPRIQEAMDHWIPNEEVRKLVLAFLAFAIENADEEASSGWYLRETDHGLRLMAGRFAACEIRRSNLRVTVMGPVGEELRAALDADTERDVEFKKIPGAVQLAFPAERGAACLDQLKEGFNSFVDLAMARIRHAVSLEDHCPEAVAYVARVVGRDLPQPKPTEETTSETEDDQDDEEVSRAPMVRGRPPIFEIGNRSISSLISEIEREVIALPNLQRPFVWEDTKVRDLLDSLFVGFPVGTLVLWHVASEKDARALGELRGGLAASTLIIDGQQRLTSLYAVMKGVEVTDKDGSTRQVTIAFRPRDGRFEVADAAIRKDPEFLPNVTELWSGARSKPQIRRDLMNAVRDAGRLVDEAYEDAVERNLDRAHSIADYRFPTVDIRKTSNGPEGEAPEEDVAEIFVRINNQGTRLGQADFVLTLLSVFHGELRDRIEVRSRAMSQGGVVAIDTQQLLRAACAVAFGRARMSAVYRFLRGVDPSTGEADAESRSKRLKQLDDAANECIATVPWRDFLLRVSHAGFVSPALVASKNAIVNAFAFYIRGRKAGVQKQQLDELISRWTFGALLTRRYSGSSETVFEQDLARVSRLDPFDASGFVRALDDALGEVLTGDYWTRALVTGLETQKARTPEALAFRAAQVVLGTRALFSDQLLGNLLSPQPEAGRAASEVHHLFPQQWLQSNGVPDRRLINQVANLADVGWHENNVIGARKPAEYVPRIRDKLKIDDGRWGRMCAEHALPPGWESMPYQEFLRERRTRMADIIRVAYRQLGGESDSPPLSPPWFLPGADAVWQKIGDTERALRAVVREVYVSRWKDAAARKIEEAVPEQERGSLARALRARPANAEPLSIVEYLYFGQLPPLLFANDVWQEAKGRMGDAKDAKQRLQTAVGQVVPVRNEIAHVREVSQERLLKATVACNEILELFQR